jgi:hypothetical protein
MFVQLISNKAESLWMLGRRRQGHGSSSSSQGNSYVLRSVYRLLCQWDVCVDVYTKPFKSPCFFRRQQFLNGINFNRLHVLVSHFKKYNKKLDIMINKTSHNVTNIKSVKIIESTFFFKKNPNFGNSTYIQFSFLFPLCYVHGGEFKGNLLPPPKKRGSNFVRNISTYKIMCCHVANGTITKNPLD